LGADGGLRHRNGQSRTPVAERISGAENRILSGQIKGRLLLSEGEKATLAEIAQRLGRKALEELAAVAKPDTLLAWYRKLIANKFDGSKFRQRVPGEL
jgi:putative transposase